MELFWTPRSIARCTERPEYRSARKIAMGQINVMLCIQPRLLSAVVRQVIERQPDMVVIGEAGDVIALEYALRTCKAQVAIVTPAYAGSEPALCRRLWAQTRRLSVMTLWAKTGTVLLYGHESDGSPKRIEDAGEEALLSAIRGVNAEPMPGKPPRPAGGNGRR